AGPAADGLLSRGASGTMTARLDLMAHGASAATRAARFPDDETLEASAIGALEALRGRLRPYAQALTAPSRAARGTAAALGLDAEVELALRECDMGAGVAYPRRRLLNASPMGSQPGSAILRLRRMVASRSRR